MCGIVGYTGADEAAPILLHGLERLEYRGYDSAGIAVYDNGKIEIAKAKGKLEALKQLTANGKSIHGHCGIGHTRWATHGEPSVTNAHPHTNKDKTISIVHNGIIENYKQLKERLIRKGYEFVSETDTEVVVQLLDYYYQQTKDIAETLKKVVYRIEGSYALGILFSDEPGVIYALRKDSPLIVGTADGNHYIASDVPAILKYTRNVYYIDNREIVRLASDGITFYNAEMEVIEKEMKVIEWDMESAEKGGYEHFMLKEIYEQPKAVADTITPRIKDKEIVIEELNMTDEEIKNLSRIYIVACGSAYHAGVVGKYTIEKMTRIPVEVDLASEFRYRNPILDKNAMVIIVSQSGETADSLAALRLVQEQGIKVMGIVNVVGSSIAREADNVLYTWAGPEIAVATTKAYSAQVAAFYLLSLKFAKVRNTVSEAEYEELLSDLLKIPEKIQEVLGDKEKIQWFASKYANARDVFFIGRCVDYATSLEGSLKFKEISYIHSEAYAAGELKHGPISLIEDGILVVSVMTQPDLYEKMVSNVKEVITRGAYVYTITNKDNKEVEDISGFTSYIPKINPYFAPSLSVVPLQILSYYVSISKGLDVDKPRNLAKSVTVE